MRSTSSTLHHVTETAVLPSEIEQLPDLTGYLKFASRRAWLLVSLKPTTVPRSATRAAQVS